MLNEKLELWLRRRINELDNANSGLRQLAYQNLLTSFRENQHIARQLHDDVAMGLLCCNIKLKQLQEKDSDMATANTLQEVREHVGNLIDRTKRIISQLGPALTEKLSLEAAIDGLAREVETVHHISCKTELDRPLATLTDEIFMVAYQSIHELLRNIERFAFAENITIYAQNRENSLEVVVRDDGIGFDAAGFFADVRQKHKVGLLSIQEWMQCIGGQFDIESQPGSGTHATLTIPLKRA